MLKAAPQIPVEGSSNTNTQATEKNNTSKRNKRKNKKKSDAPIPQEHHLEASIVPEGDIFLQNDPYLLEDMMKEIELPEKETLPYQKNRPKKPMVDVKCKTFQNLNTTQLSSIPIFTFKYSYNFKDIQLNHLRPVFQNFLIRPYRYSDAGKSYVSFQQRLCYFSRRTPFLFRSRISVVPSLTKLPIFKLF